MNGALLSIERLITEINKVIDKHIDNLELKRTLVEVFSQKGLKAEKINLIMEEEMSLAELNDMEKIAFANGCHKVFKDNSHLNAEKYYAKNIIESYNNFTVQEQKIDLIEFENFLRKNDEEYFGLISYKQIYDYMINNLFTYNIDIQRSPSFKKVGSKSIRTASIDQNAVDSIKESMLKNEFEDTQIVLTLLVKDDGTYPKFDFKEKFNNFGDITIGSSICINDGFHRSLACTNAYIEHLQKYGEELNATISVKFVICDSARAKRITKQSFLKSSTDMEWIKANDENDYTNFINKLINNSKLLKDNVGTTFEEAKALNKLTYKALLVQMTKKLNIDVANKSVSLIKSKKMAEYIDTLFDLLNEEIKNHDRDFSYIYHSDIFSLYFKLAYDMSETGEDIDRYNDLIIKLLSAEDEDIKSLKLHNKNTNLNKILEFFGI